MAVKDVLLANATKIAPDLPDRCCGRCTYARGKLSHPELPPEHRICYGMPPVLSLHMIGVTPDKQPQFVRNAERPRVAAIDPPCSLFRSPTEN